MNFTMSRQRPTNLHNTGCIHCDEDITLEDGNFYVQMLIGDETVALHDPCFTTFVAAINKFNTMFVENPKWGVSVN